MFIEAQEAVEVAHASLEVIEAALTFIEARDAVEVVHIGERLRMHL